MSEILRGANRFSSLSDEAATDFLSCVRTKNYTKGDVIHEVGRVCRHLFFVESGLVKHFYYYNGTQYVLRFLEEQSFFIVTDSFFDNLPAEYSTSALEQSTVSYIEYDDFERLCQKYHSFESFARKFVSIVAYTAISNLKGLLYLNATERYAKFMKEYGHLQQRISLGDTAGYLGISQVSLSRIRSKK